MNEPDHDLRAAFARQRRRDESLTPSFHAMSDRARTAGIQQHQQTIWTRVTWLAPALAGLIVAFVVLRPQPEPPHEYSDRVTTLIAEFDLPTFAHTALPSDQLPPAFPEL